MQITEFLEARIAEDERQASALLRDLEGEIAEKYPNEADEHGPCTPQRLLKAQMWAQYDGQSKRRSFAKGQQIAYLASPARVLAECAAKRAITEIFGKSSLNLHAQSVIRGLAAVYSSHKDYRQEWAA